MGELGEGGLENGIEIMGDYGESKKHPPVTRFGKGLCCLWRSHVKCGYWQLLQLVNLRTYMCGSLADTGVV